MLQAQDNNYMGNDYLSKRKREKHEVTHQEINTQESWNVFCDFPEISHIAITGVNVCISRQDNFAMVRAWSLIWYCTVKRRKLKPETCKIVSKIFEKRLRNYSNWHLKISLS